MRLIEQDQYSSAGVQRITLLRALLVLTMVLPAGLVSSTFTGGS